MKLENSTENNALRKCSKELAATDRFVVVVFTEDLHFWGMRGEGGEIKTCKMIILQIHSL